MPLRIKSLKGRLWHNYLDSWVKKNPEYRFVAEQAIAEIMQQALKQYANVTINRLLDVLTSDTPKEPLTQTEIEICYKEFPNTPFAIEAMHKFFDKRVKDYDAYEAGELDARDVKSFYEERECAWAETFTIERKKEWIRNHVS